MTDRKLATPATRPQNTADMQNRPLFVVGIGSSAGGLEALTQFFTSMPEDSGLAFILVTHLDPNHSSMLPELIQNKTKMKVSQITSNMPIAGDQVYVIPPDSELDISNGTLQLSPRNQPESQHRPIDSFFRSLALDQGEKAIGIILSGTGTDGTLGIKAIKAEAGLAMVQDTDSAKFEGMPTNAAATGLADYILPPEKMPEQLLRYIRYHHKKSTAGKHHEDDYAAGALKKIFAILRSGVGHDFSLYKKNTIQRRVERRMYVHRLNSMDEYIRYLKESEREVFILFKELLIGVTNFFRDPEAFQVLKEKYLLPLLKSKPDDNPFRVWVPGCSSGEEAYSIAIIVKECLEKLGRQLDVQIFGTDLDEEAINIARSGTYLNSISIDVSQERLDKYFIKKENHYQIKKNIREMVVFAEQNVIKDPPFTRLDLLSCRNLLIYFGSELQEKLLPTFHYSLREGGLLLLGTSENTGRSTDMFNLLDKKWKIFKRLSDHGSVNRPMELPKIKQVDRSHEASNLMAATANRDAGTIRLLKAILAQSNLPVCAVVDDKAELIYTHGRTGRFLEPAEGEASNNILHMARPGLKEGLTNAIRKMSTERAEILIENLQVKTNGDFQDINLIVRPLPEFQRGYRGLMLIIFEEVIEEQDQDKEENRAKIKSAKSRELKRLKDELSYTRENLQSTIEELETSNEELKSTNEELQSANEELQSTNEELETSREELQSLNEEASTVNSELHARIDELVSANDDIKNLLDATDIATMFLDIELKIRRFTPQIAGFFHLTPADAGRSLEHFASTLKDVDIQEHAKQVLRTLEKHESVIENGEGQKYRMRIRPFRTVNNVIEGVVITFENVTEFKKMVDALAVSEASWHELIEHSPVGIFVLTGELFSYINPAGRGILGTSSPDELLGSSIHERVHENSRRKLTDLLDSMNRRRETFPPLEEKFVQVDGNILLCSISMTPIVYRGKPSTVVYAMVKDKVASS